MLTWSNFFHSH